MRFSENGYYVEKYLKCANCGLLVYGPGIEGHVHGKPGLFCSEWCVEWARLREEAGGGYPDHRENSENAVFLDKKAGVAHVR